MMDFFKYSIMGLPTIVGKAVILAISLTGCVANPTVAPDIKAANAGLMTVKVGLFEAATFAADGKLWRVSADKNHVYVDSSADRGSTFSKPVIVNKESQHIKTSFENRLNIVVDQRNRVLVTYPAEGQQPSSLFFSFSDDGGNSFSNPREISDKADEAISLQASFAVSPNGTPYIFWHDDRDKTDYRQIGNAVYYSTILENGALSVNRKAANDLCECCRLAIDFFSNGEPVIFGRFIFDGHSRDHGLVVLHEANWQTSRITTDDWSIDVCPEQGPALAISATNDMHIAWFTQGTARNGMFYAYSKDHGITFSEPMRFGNTTKLSKFPTISVSGNHVVLSWIEFNGNESELMIMQSNDSGNTWSSPTQLAHTESVNDRPVAIRDNQNQTLIYWNTRNEGFRLFSVR